MNNRVKIPYIKCLLHNLIFEYDEYIDYINNNDESVNLDEQSLNQLISLCKNHSILPILYQACIKYNITLNEKQKVFLKREYELSLMREATQELEKQEILKTLEK